jgi:hypothetical protein
MPTETWVENPCPRVSIGAQTTVGNLESIRIWRLTTTKLRCDKFCLVSSVHLRRRLFQCLLIPENVFYLCIQLIRGLIDESEIASFNLRPPPWNILQFRHCASEGSQSAMALPLDEGFESFTNQRLFLCYPSELLGDAYEIVIKRNGCSRRTPKH